MSASNAYTNSAKRQMPRSRSSSRERLGRKTPRLEKLTPQRVPRSTSSHVCGTRKSIAVRRSVSASALTPGKSQATATCLRDKTVAGRKEAEVQDFCMSVCGLMEPLAFPLSSGQYKTVFTLIMRVFDPNFRDLPQPFDKVMPQVLCDVGFAPNDKPVSRQTFQTLGTPFSWPVALAALAHIMELAKATSAIASLPTADLEFQDDPTLNLEFDFFVNCYKTFNERGACEEDFKQQLEQFERELSQGLDVGHAQQQLEQITQEVTHLKPYVATLRTEDEQLSAKATEMRYDVNRASSYIARTKEYQGRKMEDTEKTLEYIQQRRAYKSTMTEQMKALEKASLGMSSVMIKAEMKQLQDSIQHSVNCVNFLDDEYRKCSQEVASQSNAMNKMVEATKRVFYESTKIIEKHGMTAETLVDLDAPNLKTQEIKQDIAQVARAMENIEKVSAAQLDSLAAEVTAQKVDLAEDKMSRDKFVQLLVAKSEEQVQKRRERSDKKKELKATKAQLKAENLEMDLSFPELEGMEQGLHKLRLEVEESEVKTAEEEERLKELLNHAAQKIDAKRQKQLAVLDEYLNEYKIGANEKISATQKRTNQIRGLSNLLPTPPPKSEKKR